MYSNAYVWSRVLSYLEQHSPAIAIASYFDDAEVIELTESKLVIYSPSSFRKDVIRASAAPIRSREAMRDEFQTEVEVVVLDETELAALLAKTRKTAISSSSTRSIRSTNSSSAPRTSFALAAARAVAANAPADAYNPAVHLRAESGLGKTHLLYAIANEIHKRAPGAITSSTSRATSSQTS